MSEDKKILDLDELFGQARAVKVKWQDREYELLKLEGVNPQEAVRFQKLQIAASKLQAKDDIDDASAKQIEKLVDDMLTLLCKALPIREMPFMVKMRVLTYYMEETQGKKAMETALNKVAIGARSSAH